MGQYEELKAVLDNARNEHDIDTYLKSHRELLRGIGGLYWNCMVIQPEFQIGTKYRISRKSFDEWLDQKCENM